MNCLWLVLPRSCRCSQATIPSLLFNSFIKSLGKNSHRAFSTLECSDSTIVRFERFLGVRQKCSSRSSSIYQHCLRSFATQGRIITSFDELPRKYRDNIGLAFRAYPLTVEEVGNVFGFGMNPQNASKILEIVHGRRIAGTLGDPDLYRNDSMAEKFQFKAALDWLRANVPVDEDYNAGRRAEMELMELDPDALTQDGSEVYIPNSGVKDAKRLHGESVLDKIREAKLMRKEAQERRQKEIETREATKKGAAGQSGLPTVVDGPSTGIAPKQPSARLQYYLDRAKILPEAPPDWTPFRRLWPSAVSTLCVLAGCLALAIYYSPPKRSSRLWPDIPPSASTVGAIIMANLIITLLWRNPPSFRFLNRYFISVPGYPNPFAILGNVFSHQQFGHLGTNMILLWLIGTRLHEDVGRGNFLAIYLACGALSTFSSLTFHTLTKTFIISSMGASGAVCGIVGAYLWLNIWEPMRLLGIFPPPEWYGIPAWLILGGLVLSDYQLARKWKLRTHKVDFAAHLGGYASGVAAAQGIKWRMEQRRRSMTEKSLVRQANGKTQIGMPPDR